MHQHGHSSVGRTSCSTEGPVPMRLLLPPRRSFTPPRITDLAIALGQGITILQPSHTLDEMLGYVSTSSLLC